MKTTMKQLATVTVLAFLLLTGNANAHGTAVKYASFDESEATLQLESWMTDETIWNSNTTAISQFTVETEFEHKIENWMINPEIWNFNSAFTEETEVGLAIENWMTDQNIWDLKNEEIEPELALELWMINNEIWK